MLVNKGRGEHLGNHILPDSDEVFYQSLVPTKYPIEDATGILNDDGWSKTKTKTNTKCLKHPTYALFWKSSNI